MDEYRKRQRLAYLLSLDSFPGVMCKALCMQVSRHHFVCSRSALPKPLRILVCDEFLLIILAVLCLHSNFCVPNRLKILFKMVIWMSWSCRLNYSSQRLCLE